MRKFFTFIGALALCGTGHAQAQTIDTALVSSLAPAAARDLYEVCRHSAISPQQQADLAELFKAEDVRFMELASANGGFLTLEAEKELEAIRDRSLREVLTEQQLMDYFRYLATDYAYKAGHEARDAVMAQMDLSYMEKKYINNTFFVIEQDSRAVRMLYKGRPEKIRAAIQAIYDREIGYLQQKSGIFVDKDMKATRTLILNDYAPLTPETAARPAE